MLEYDGGTHEIRQRIAAEVVRCNSTGGAEPRDRVEARRRRAIIARAQNQVRNDRNLLRRSSQTKPAANDVLALLENCSEDRPCGSAACATCTVKTSMTVTPLVAWLIAGHPGPWSYATIINTRPTIPQGRLAGHLLYAEFEAKLHQFFAEHGAIAIGTLEISCNEHHAEAHGPRYVEHAHIFTPLRITRAIRRQLLAIFPRTKGVKRPLKVRPYDGNDDAIDYGLKTHVVRRIQLPRTQKDGSRTIFSTRKRGLRGSQRVEVAIATRGRAAIDQLFAHGISVDEANDGIRLVERDRHG